MLRSALQGRKGGQTAEGHFTQMQFRFYELARSDSGGGGKRSNQCPNINADGQGYKGALRGVSV